MIVSSDSAEAVAEVVRELSASYRRSAEQARLAAEHHLKMGNTDTHQFAKGYEAALKLAATTCDEMDDSIYAQLQGNGK